MRKGMNNPRMCNDIRKIAWESPGSTLYMPSAVAFGPQTPSLESTGDNLDRVETSAQSESWPGAWRCTLGDHWSITAHFTECICEEIHWERYTRRPQISCCIPPASEQRPRWSDKAGFLNNRGFIGK